jgi:rubrerythrin
MERERSRRALVGILRLAYSGERAAAYAYRGHWASVSDPEECRRIHEIEDEEWHHRRLVGVMLRELGSGPSGWLELKAVIIGRTLAFLCRFSGWFCPMYGAGRLERRNIAEYEAAARHARDCGQEGLVDCLLRMAEVEWEHERWFRQRVLSHPLSRRLPVWPEPPPKSAIREAFAGPAAAQRGPATPHPEPVGTP